jgi:hypothetical protein
MSDFGFSTPRGATKSGQGAPIRPNSMAVGPPLTPGQIGRGGRGGSGGGSSGRGGGGGGGGRGGGPPLFQSGTAAFRGGPAPSGASTFSPQHPAARQPGFPPASFASSYTGGGGGQFYPGDSSGSQFYPGDSGGARAAAPPSPFFPGGGHRPATDEYHTEFPGGEYTGGRGSSSGQYAPRPSRPVPVEEGAASPAAAAGWSSNDRQTSRPSAAGASGFVRQDAPPRAAAVSLRGPQDAGQQQLRGAALAGLRDDRHDASPGVQASSAQAVVPFGAPVSGGGPAPRVTFALPRQSSAPVPAPAPAEFDARVDEALARLDAIEASIQQLCDEARWFYGLIDGDSSRKCVVYADPPAADGSIGDPIREVSGGKWLRLSYPKLTIEEKSGLAGEVPTRVSTWYCVHTVDKYGDCMQVWIQSTARDGQATFKKFATSTVPALLASAPL